MINLVFGLAVRVILADDKGQVLIIKRSSNSKTNAGRWELPGGKVDESESFDQALIREVQEETGLQISLDHVVGVAEQNLHLIRAVHIIMSGKIIGGELSLSTEHEGYAWVPLTDLANYELADWLEAFISDHLSTTEENKEVENVLNPWIGSLKGSLDKIMNKKP